MFHSVILILFYLPLCKSFIFITPQRTVLRHHSLVRAPTNVISPLFANHDTHGLERPSKPSLLRKIGRGAKTLLSSSFAVLFQKIVRAAKTLFLSALALLSITFATPKLSHARVGREDLSVVQVLAAKPDKVGATIVEHKPTPCEELLEKESKSKLDFLGYGLVAGSILATVMSRGGDGSKPSKSTSKMTRRATRLDDDETLSTDEKRSSEKFRSTKLKDGLSNLNPLPKPDELFEADNIGFLKSSSVNGGPANPAAPSKKPSVLSLSEDLPAPRQRTSAVDDVLSHDSNEPTPEPSSPSAPKKSWGVGARYREQQEVTKKGQTIEPSNAIHTPVALQAEQPPKKIGDDDDLFSDDLFDEPPASSASGSVKETTAPPPPPPAAKKAPGFLDRLFKKPGGNRPIVLPEVMEQADAAKNFRSLVGAILSSYLPSNAFPEFKRGGKYVPIFIPGNTEDEQAAAVLESKDKSGLTPQQAADAYAEVASVMVVQLTDSAVASLSAKPQDDSATIAALEVLTDLMRGAEVVFLKNFQGVSIDPVLYNGKAKKGKLEDLYVLYCKETMTRDATLAMKGMDPAAPQAGPLAGPLAGQAGEDQQQASSESASSDDMANRLMRVSQLFGLSENKRNTLEQRAMKDVMMAGGAGGFGDMGALMDMLNPGGSQGDIPMGNMKNFMDGKMDAPLPDFSNMDPKEVAKIAGDLMAQVKASVRDGSITKQDIYELEKVLQMDIRDLGKMINAPNVDKRKLKEMSPEIAEMAELFQQLAEIKNR